MEDAGNNYGNMGELTKDSIEFIVIGYTTNIFIFILVGLEGDAKCQISSLGRLLFLPLLLWL